MGAGELEAIDAMLRSVIDGIADPVYAEDADGRYLLVNLAAADASGPRPDQILGHADADLLPGPAAASLRARDEGGTVVEARTPGPTATPAAPEGRPA